jgi:hypothetical protein
LFDSLQNWVWPFELILEKVCEELPPRHQSAPPLVSFPKEVGENLHFALMNIAKIGPAGIEESIKTYKLLEGVCFPESP